MNGLETTASLTTGEKLKLGHEGPAVAMATPQKTQPTQLGAPPKMLGTLTMNGNGQPTPPATEADATPAAPAPASGPRIKLASPADTAATGNQYAANTPDAGTQAMPTIPVAPQASDSTAAQNASINPADTVADAPSADGKQFRWPVRGRIISGFGTKPNGEKNDGINLAVPEGTSVKAIEAGKVIYAGNELAGYGNLVLVRHAGGWVSAYAHNKDLTVKRGDTVQRGQTIAHAGMTGSVTSPQVHFELRQGAKPVNPLDYLAGA
jgi:murein DD-endopeptidase MepM/ murein hydrolase activator NlpD